LTLINVELASAEGVGLARSGAVLFATVIGGTATFFGPVLGALALTFFSIALASLTRAWPLYLGLLFVVIVVGAPDGIAGWAARRASRDAQYGWRAVWREYAFGAMAAFAWTAALIWAVEPGYARQFAADAGGVWRVGALAIDVASPSTWGIVVALALAGWAAARAAGRSAARLDRLHQRERVGAGIGAATGSGAEGGNAADGNAANGNAANGNAADGNAADGNAADGNAAGGSAAGGNAADGKETTR
jgi:branched-chain amino acid transport system permease protein